MLPRPSFVVTIAALAAGFVILPPTGRASAAPAALPKVRIAGDGRSFATGDNQPFVPMGVNYFRPNTGWAPQLWKKFDAEATRGDFARMKALGVNCVRVFLSYGSFCTNAGELSADGLAKFDRLLSFAEENGIYVHPTGLDHWEGVPPWARGDRYAEEGLLAAQESFWKLFAARYRGRNVLFAYDLLNEPMVRWDSPALRTKWTAWLAAKYGAAAKWAAAWEAPQRESQWGRVPPPAEKDAPGSRELLDYQAFRESVADDWTRRQVAAIKSADPEALVTVGFIQWAVPVLLPKVSIYAAFRPERQAKWLDFLEIHFYPLERGFYEYREEDEARNLAYLESVVREVARPGKPVVLAEFGWYGGGKLTLDGGRHAPATEDQQARWCRRAVETTAGHVTGWLNWGLYDHPEARDVTQLTGLLSVDGKTKRWGEVFRELGRRYAGQRIPLPATGSAVALDWDAALTSVQAGHDFRAQSLKSWKKSDAPRP